jgi:hypothetical protein
MTIIISPIKQALKVVSELFDNLFDEETEIFIDNFSDDLQKLTRQIIQVNCHSSNQSKVNTILIRIGNSQSRENQVYTNLLENLLNKNKLGISCPINSIVSALLDRATEYTVIITQLSYSYLP